MMASPVTLFTGQSEQQPTDQPDDRPDDGKKQADQEVGVVAAAAGHGGYSERSGS